MPVQSQIDQSAYGSATDRADFGGTVTKVLQGAEKEKNAREDRLQKQEDRDLKKSQDAQDRAYLKSERSEQQLARENAYVKENYEGSTIDQTGVAERDAAYVNLFKESKTKLAGLDRKDPETEGERRKIFGEVEEVNVGIQAWRGLTENTDKLLKEGGISTSTPTHIRQFALDSIERPGDFVPQRTDDGTIAIFDKSTNDFVKTGDGGPLTVAGIANIKISPKRNLNTEIENDVKLIAKKTQEVANEFGGSTVYTNTPGLINNQLDAIVSNKLQSSHNLYEIAAEMGIGADQRDDYEDDDALRAEVSKLYKERLLPFVDSSTQLQGAQVASTASTSKGKPTDAQRRTTRTNTLLNQSLKASGTYTEEDVAKLGKLKNVGNIINIEYDSETFGSDRVGIKYKNGDTEYFDVDDPNLNQIISNAAGGGVVGDAEQNSSAPDITQYDFKI